MWRGYTKRGFTLIELLVVIAIIGILATIVIIQLGGAQTRARNSNAKSDITEIGKAIETWKTSNNVDNVSASGAYTAAATVFNSSSAMASLLGTHATFLNATTTNGGFTALFATNGAFPLTVSKTPSTAYNYLYITNSPVAGDAVMSLPTNAAASTYCIATNVVSTANVPDSGFFVNNGASATSSAAGGGVTSSFGGGNSGKCS